jgi:hypothetical protein
MARHSPDIFSTVPGFHYIFCAGRRQRSVARSIPNSSKVAGVMILGVIMVAVPALAEDLRVCQDPKNAISISQSNLAPAAFDVHMEQDSSNSKAAVGVLHFYLRSDGAIKPQKVCATAHFADTRDEPQTVSVTLVSGANVTSQREDQNTSCVALTTPWKTFQERPFDLHMDVDQNLIPLSGSVSLSASGTSKEPVVPDTVLKKQNSQGRSSAGRQDPILTYGCTTSSKVLTRAVLLLPSITPSSLKVPLIGGVGVAVLYFLISMVILWQKKGLPMGGPQWSFTTSFATNFTVGTGLLTPFLGAGVLTDALHYMTRFHYVVLGILFAALLLLGPAFFSFFSIKRQVTNGDQTSMAPVGTVGLFLGTSALMIGAAVGQLLTVGFATAEVEFRGYINCTTLIVVLVLLLVAGAGTIASAIITIRFYLKQDPVKARQSIGHLQSIGQKIAGLRSGVEHYSAASELFTDRDRDAIDRAVEQHSPELRTWNMF